MDAEEECAAIFGIRKSDVTPLGNSFHDLKSTQVSGEISNRDESIGGLPDKSPLAFFDLCP